MHRVRGGSRARCSVINGLAFPAGRTGTGRVVCLQPSARPSRHSCRAQNPPRGEVVVFLTLAQLRRFGPVWVRCFLEKWPTGRPQGEGQVLPLVCGGAAGQGGEP